MGKGKSIGAEPAIYIYRLISSFSIDMKDDRNWSVATSYVTILYFDLYHTSLNRAQFVDLDAELWG
jgi:hypothetical protein